MPHAPKSPKAAEVRRKRIVQAAINGENLREVAISTGLSPLTAGSQASQILKHPEAQKAFVMTLEEEGLTDKFLAQKAKSLLDAKKTIFFQKDGVVTDSREVAAIETQRKTFEAVSKMKGHLKDHEKGDVNIGLMQMVVNAISESSGTGR